MQIKTAVGSFMSIISTGGEAAGTKALPSALGGGINW